MQTHYKEFKNFILKKSAFTLAEMMVVMLILSITLAGMAPIVTTRITKQQSAVSGASTIWQWVDGVIGTNAFFGEGEHQRAVIGNNTIENIDNEYGYDLAKLIIHNSNGTPSHILFKDSLGNPSAQLRVDNESIIFNQAGNEMSQSVAIGVGAAESYKDNIGSVAIGYNALKYGKQYTYTYTYIPYPNIAIGYNALNFEENKDPDEVLPSEKISNNIAIGTATLTSMYKGSDNIAIGESALSKSQGSSNIAIGKMALQNHNSTNGSHNIAIGEQAIGAGISETYSGGYNIALGYQALSKNTTGAHNIAFGKNALGENTSGTSNIAIGNYALENTPTYKQTAAGSEKISENNIAIGNNTLQGTIGKVNNIAIGPGALGLKTSSEKTERLENNIAIGYNALKNGGSINDVIAIGYEAAVGKGSSIGSHSVYVGDQVAKEIEGGKNNVFIGSQAGIKFVEGNNNTVVGAGALGDLDTGSSNTALGYKACSGVKGNNKTCIGAYEGGTSYSGPRAGTEEHFSNENWFSENDTVERIFIGTTPDSYNSSASIKGSAVLEIHNPRKNDKVTNGTSEVTISDVSQPQNKNHYFPTVVINGNLIVRGRTQLAHGAVTNSSEHYYAKYSDARLKDIGTENTTGLEKIKQLKVFNYTFKTDKNKTPRVGIIAQDLQKVFPDAVTKDENGYLKIRMEDMFYAMVNAIKELNTKIILLADIIKQNQNDIKTLKKENIKLKEKNKSIEKQLREIEAKLK